MATTIPNFGQLFNMFDKAAESLKFPRMQLEHDNAIIRMIRCGPNSHYHGGINVEINGVWFGRIERDGNMYGYRHCQLRRENVDVGLQGIFEYLLAFSENPTFHARMHGHRYNYCCFCSRELTNAVSVVLGYGPICAGKYGLPHDHETVVADMHNAECSTLDALIAD